MFILIALGILAAVWAFLWAIDTLDAFTSRITPSERRRAEQRRRRSQTQSQSRRS